MIRQLHEGIGESLGEVQCIEDLFRDVRIFLDEVESGMISCEINKEIDEAVRMCGADIRRKSEIHRDYGDLPRVVCHPGRMRQVFVDLLLNAAEAIEKDGVIRIETRVGVDKVSIKIRDNGKGDRRDITRIFNPFCLPKTVWNNAEIGLFRAQRIVRAHGGSIDISSEIGKGSSVVVLLPMLGPSAEWDVIDLYGEGGEEGGFQAE